MLLHWKFRYLIIFCQGAFANFLNVITVFQKQNEILLLLHCTGSAPPKAVWLEYLKPTTSLQCWFCFPQFANFVVLSVPAEVFWKQGRWEIYPTCHKFKSLKHSNKMITKTIVVIRIKGNGCWVIVSHHWRLQQCSAFTGLGKALHTFWELTGLIVSIKHTFLSPGEGQDQWLKAQPCF